jgi:hypothetical protein
MYHWLPEDGGAPFLVNFYINNAKKFFFDVQDGGQNMEKNTSL